jgi:hypothetical protein
VVEKSPEFATAGVVTEFSSKDSLAQKPNSRSEKVSGKGFGQRKKKKGKRSRNRK